MTIAEFRPQVNGNLVPMTVIYPITKNNEVIMGVKKKKFGVGKLLGFGGKLDSGESFLSCAARELEEEACITPVTIEHRGTVKSYYLQDQMDKYLFSVHLEIFVCTEWKGEAKSTEEQSVEYFHKDSLPLERMITDTRHFVPLLFDGNKREWVYEFLYDADNNLIDVASSL